MSQPCLPLPRRRKREESERNSKDDINNDIFRDEMALSRMDASEYLYRVKQQAERLPENFNAPDNESFVPAKASSRSSSGLETGSAASLRYLLSDRTTLHPPPSRAHLPIDEDWLKDTLDSFQKLRDYLETCKENGIGRSKQARLPVPPLKERAMWLVFCIGDTQAQGNKDGYFDDSPNDLQHQSGQETPLWKPDLPENGYVPSVQLIAQMDQVMVRRVLGHLGYFIHHGWDLSPDLSRWIYALLANLEKPIHRDDAARLHSLLRKLTSIRASVEPGSNDLAQINLLITILAIYFEQGSERLMKIPAKEK